MPRIVYKRLGYDNIIIHHGDGTQGWPEHAPYDGIIVAAGGPDIPAALRQQLAIGGQSGHARRPRAAQTAT